MIQLAVIMITWVVITQDHVHQYFEDILPYEQFSIRLSNADIPRLPAILRTVSDEQYARLLAGVEKYHRAFLWDLDAGGQAFDYTILALRRRYLAIKAAYLDAPNVEEPKIEL